jgi:hypothetical protein
LITAAAARTDAPAPFVGTVTVLGGKGRFDGVAGDGTVTGTRYTPLSVGADLVSDYTVRIEK